MCKKQFYFWFLLVSSLFVAESYAQQVFHVVPSTEKSGNGTLESPFATLESAIESVADVNKDMTEDIVVNLHAGNYYLDAPLLFKEKDSGTNGYKVIYKAYNDDLPLISGGKDISGWKKVKGNVYKATLDRDTKLRSLFVNGKRAVMAGANRYVNGNGSCGELEVTGRESWAYGSGKSIEGICFSKSDVSVFKNPEDVELVQDNVWTEKILCVEDISKDGKNIIMKLQQPYGTIITSMAWAGKTKYEGEFLVRNAFELLDSPGEFYFDKASHTVYYYSRGEDMSQAKVIAPMSKGLIRMYGSSVSSRVHDIQFEGIAFSHDSWSLMEIDGSFGFGGIQSLAMAVKYIPDGNWHPTKYNSTDVPPGAIDLKNCDAISFVRNQFQHLGSAIAINMVNDVVNCNVTGNVFHDLLGNAVNVGHPQHYIIGDGDIFKEGVEGVCKHVNVSNNYIRDVCKDFRQVEAITSYFVESITINHNDISGTPYGAIVCGWWWGNTTLPPSKVAKNNSICYNKAGNTHQALHDGGIIYTLGEQPNTVISNNYLFNGPRSIYPDDGSAHLRITNNVVKNSGLQAWLHIWTSACHDLVLDSNYVKNNLATNNGTNVTISNLTSFRQKEFSGRAVEIINESGLESEYDDIIPESEFEKVDLYPTKE